MLAVQNGGEKPGMCARSAVGRKKGTYCTDKRQAGTSRAFRKGVVAQIFSPSALPLCFSPYHLLLFLLLLLTTTTARCWLDQCSLPWQPRSGRSRGGGGGASRDRASLFPDWSEAGWWGLDAGWAMTSHDHRFPDGRDPLAGRLQAANTDIMDTCLRWG